VLQRIQHELGDAISVKKNASDLSSKETTGAAGYAQSRFFQLCIHIALTLSSISSAVFNQPNTDHIRCEVDLQYAYRHKSILSRNESESQESI